MTLLENSAFKVKASTVATSVGIVPEKGALLFDENLNTHVLGNGTAWVPVLVEPYADTFWLDLLGPVTGSRLDSSSGRIDFDYFNGAIGFQANARYPNEPLVFRMQIQHYWKIETAGKPHIHWKQQHATEIPNWLFAWKFSKNGAADAIETDWTNYTLSVIESHAFEYSSGVMNQISIFPDMDLTGGNVSDLLTCVLFRDSGNDSSLFAGNDPSSLVEIVTDLDLHIQVDTPGSRQEYIK